MRYTWDGQIPYKKYPCGIEAANERYKCRQLLPTNAADMEILVLRRNAIITDLKIQRQRKYIGLF